MADLTFVAGAWWGAPWAPNEFAAPDNLRALSYVSSLKDIADGMSQTVLITEQAGVPSFYSRGAAIPEEDGFLMGHAWARCREHSTIYTSEWLSNHADLGPAINGQNRTGVYAFHRGANAVFADGSVHLLGEGTSFEVVGALMGRDDGTPIDAKARQ